MYNIHTQYTFLFFKLLCYICTVHVSLVVQYQYQDYKKKIIRKFFFYFLLFNGRSLRFVLSLKLMIVIISVKILIFNTPIDILATRFLSLLTVFPLSSSIPIYIFQMVFFHFPNAFISRKCGISSSCPCRALGSVLYY